MAQLVSGWLECHAGTADQRPGQLPGTGITPLNACKPVVRGMPVDNQLVVSPLKQSHASYECFLLFLPARERLNLGSGGNYLLPRVREWANNKDRRPRFLIIGCILSCNTTSTEVFTCATVEGYAYCRCARLMISFPQLHFSARLN
jgi:hypothetical protein